MNSLVKNEDRQWHEAWRVEAQRAERDDGGGEREATFLESTFSWITGAVLCVTNATHLNLTSRNTLWEAFPPEKLQTCQVNFKSYFECYHYYLI